MPRKVQGTRVTEKDLGSYEGVTVKPTAREASAKDVRRPGQPKSA